MSGPRLPGTPRLPRRKQSIYFPESMLHEVETQARRHGRSLSWAIQQAWVFGGPQLAAMPVQPPDVLE